MPTDLVVLADLTTLYQNGDPSQALMAAQAAVRKYCGWRIAGEATETVTVDSWNQDVLMLPTLKLTSVTSITIAGVAVDMTTVEVHPAGYVKKLSQYWCDPFDAEFIYNTPYYRPQAVVVMTHGCATPPLDVQLVILALAQRSIAASPSGGLVPTQQQVGQVMQSYGSSVATDGAFLESECAVLDLYKIPALA